MALRILSFIFLLVLFVARPVAVDAQTTMFEDKVFLSLPDLSVAQETALKSGYPIIMVWRDKTRRDGAHDVFGAIDIAATPKVIWKIMTDCTQTLKVVSQMIVCNVLEINEAESWDVREQIIKVGAFLPRSRSIFKSYYDEPVEIKIKLIDGNMKRQDAFWKLEKLETGQTRVFYRAALMSKYPVPGGLIKRGMAKDVPKVLNNLRDLAQENMSTLVLQANDIDQSKE